MAPMRSESMASGTLDMGVSGSRVMGFLVMTWLREHGASIHIEGVMHTRRPEDAALEKLGLPFGEELPHHQPGHLLGDGGDADVHGVQGLVKGVDPLAEVTPWLSTNRNRSTLR